MTSPELPAATLAICIDAGRRNAGELLRTLSKLDGAADCALLVHACDMDATKFGKATVFDFKRHRRIEHYGRIASQTGVIYPDGTKG